MAFIADVEQSAIFKKFNITSISFGYKEPKALSISYDRGQDVNGEYLVLGSGIVNIIQADYLALIQATIPNGIDNIGVELEKLAYAKIAENEGVTGTIE